MTTMSSTLLDDAPAPRTGEKPLSAPALAHWDSVPASGLIRVDADWMILLGLGHEPACIEIANFVRMIHAADREPFLRAWHALDGRRDAWSVALRLRAARGRWQAGRLHARVLARHADGQIARYAGSLVPESPPGTDRTQAPLAFTAVGDAIRALPSPVAVVERGTIIACSRLLEHLAAAQPGSLVGAKAHAVFGTALQARLDSLTSGPATADSILHSQIALSRRDGSLMPMQASASRFPGRSAVLVALQPVPASTESIARMDWTGGTARVATTHLAQMIQSINALVSTLAAPLASVPGTDVSTMRAMVTARDEARLLLAVLNRSLDAIWPHDAS
jgi:hypothetical protein